jgi:hypothetical protein
MDNLSAHKVAGIRERIEACGAQLLYLPPYSPDLNPIEKAWSRFKKVLARRQSTKQGSTRSGRYRCAKNHPRRKRSCIVSPLRLSGYSDYGFDLRRRIAVACTTSVGFVLAEPSLETVEVLFVLKVVRLRFVRDWRDYSQKCANKFKGDIDQYFCAEDGPEGRSGRIAGKPEVTG